MTTASTGEEGLTLAAATQPDVIILDLGLPDMDGLTVCERLREWTQIPIIVLSARDQERDKVLALDKGADDYPDQTVWYPRIISAGASCLAPSHSSACVKIRSWNAGKVKVDLMRHMCRVKRWK